MLSCICLAFWSIQSILVHFGLIRSNSVLFDVLRAYSTHFVHFSSIWSYSIHFSPIWSTSIPFDRTVHGSVRVGFVPNSELTWPHRVSNIQTCSRPIRWVGSGDSDIDRCQLVDNRTRGRRKMTKCAGNGWNLLDLVDIWPDLARFLKELTRSRRDLDEIFRNLVGSQWICWDLDEISPNPNGSVEKLS